MASSVDKFNEKAEEDKIKGLYFDGKLDKTTKVLRLDEDTGRFHPETVAEEHYSVTWEPSGKYLFHFTPEPPEAKEKPAQKLAQPIHEWLVERNSTEELVLIRADSTSTNTGSKGGAITHLEKLLGHKCQWDICEIHINELPLRHLIRKLDGPFIPKSGFTGPIGKLLHKVNDLPRNYNFTPFSNAESLIQIPEDVVNHMSTDQKNSYRLVEARITGKLTPELAAIKCGLLNTSRWLTTGEALVILSMCNHGIEGEVLRVFNVLLEFTIKVYFNLYFKIKVQHHLKYGPQHVVNSLTAK
jgi:hypothetical protein